MSIVISRGKQIVGWILGEIERNGKSRHGKSSIEVVLTKRLGEAKGHGIRFNKKCRCISV